jgi:hypothetical protein
MNMICLALVPFRVMLCQPVQAATGNLIFVLLTRWQKSDPGTAFHEEDQILNMLGILLTSLMTFSFSMEEKGAHIIGMVI